MYHNNDKAQGFTIVELMLAMAFLSMLILAIAMTTIQIGRIYTKGTTMREVNQVGRVVIDDVRRTFASSAPFDLDSTRLRYQANGSGQLCTGTYSYVWNSPQSLETAANTLKYDNGNPIYLARVVDKTQAYCSAASVPVPARNSATELLVSGDRSLVVREFSATANAVDLSSGKGQRLYMLTLQLGTNTGDEDTISSMSSCKAPEALDGGSYDYCSVNKFEIVVRAGGNSVGAR